MTEVCEPGEFDDIERAAADLAARVRSMRRAIRSLALLADEIGALRSVLDDGMPAPGEGASGRNEPQRAAPQGNANGQYPDAAAGVATVSPEPTAIGSSDAGEAEQTHSLSMTISAQRGGVDLVRLVRALQSLPSLVDLNLVRYTGDRAAIVLMTRAAPEELPVRETLLRAFPAGVLGDWVSAREFAAVIVASEGNASWCDRPSR